MPGNSAIIKKSFVTLYTCISVPTYLRQFRTYICRCARGGMGMMMARTLKIFEIPPGRDITCMDLLCRLRNSERDLRENVHRTLRKTGSCA